MTHPARPADDLASYVDAHGPGLREVLLRLDCPPFLVAGVVRETVGRCRRGWARTVRDDDVDVVVLETLVVTWWERRRATGWETRVVPVLQEVAGLDEWRAAEVAAGLRQRQRRGPATRAVAVLAVALVAVGAVAAWWPAPAREDPGGLPPATVRPERSIVDTIWYAGGVLHLPGTAAVVGPVRALTTAGRDAVYVAGGGDVIRIDTHGRRTVLGRAAPTSPLVAAGDGRLVSWREERGDVVVLDPVSGSEVGRVEEPGLEPVAIDEGRVYLEGPDGSYGYFPGAQPVHLSGLPLLDARAGSRLVQMPGDRVRLVSFGGGLSVIGAGRGGMLSPDGRFALVGTAGGPPLVHDLLGGAADTGTAPGERMVAGTLVRDGRAVLVVAVPERAADDEEFARLSASGSWELRTCVLGEGECRVAAVLSAAGDVPLFAR